MKHAMDAASGGSRARLELIEAESGNCILGEVINYPGAIASSAWGVRPLSDDFRSRIQSNCPLLIMCGDRDARTPLENAHEVLAGFPNGRLVVVEGGGHGFKPSPSLMKIVGDFFRGEELPAEQHVH
jgi:pimeloyl-ACP methyl ester carboxylesterase